MKSFLHVGCGIQNKSSLKGFNNDSWKEIRFDINEDVFPDIIGTLTDMSEVKTSSIDAIYSSHNLEHVYPHEVPDVLSEFYRVLNDDGIVVLECPDLQSASEAIVNDKLLEPLYESDSGPIAPIDLLYGLRGDLQRGNEYMAHKCGFTYSTLTAVFKDAGFTKWIGGRRPNFFDLCIVASKAEISDKDLNYLASTFLP
jgi:hypothetical protein